MLFSSYEFVFLFFPLCILLFHSAIFFGQNRGSLCILFVASLFFYAWWDIRFLPLLLGSITVNFLIGLALGSYKIHRWGSSAWLIIGVSLNLILLAFFKYWDFFASNVNGVANTSIPLISAILPLGISFFTFEQISYLVDTRRSGEPERDPLRYALFVAFFPRLVAGPILRASEFLPQVASGRLTSRLTPDLAVGLTLFAIGLFKKTVIADGVAVYATPVFAMAATGEPLDLLTAWAGALAYTMQLYFDFSGYSDMAIGAARCFGIRFPLNFWSPYKAKSIVEFWRFWHMTLSRFLRDYLYIPLGGSRRGTARRYVNLMATMLLGGLWHGANWTFVAWGALHGFYLMVNHAWEQLCRRSRALGRIDGWPATRAVYWLITFLAVVVAWVFFRAPTFVAAKAMLHAMAGLDGVSIPSGVAAALGPLQTPLLQLGVTFGAGSGSLLIASYTWIAILLIVVLRMPNAVQLLERWQPVLDQPPHSDVDDANPAVRIIWRPNLYWAGAIAAMGVLGVFAIARGGEFLYWQF